MLYNGFEIVYAQIINDHYAMISTYDVSQKCHKLICFAITLTKDGPILIIFTEVLWTK